MKKIILLFALLLSLTLTAQNFPGEKIELLSGKTLKVLPLEPSSQKYGYHAFFTDPELTKTYQDKLGNTPHEALVGKEFKVVSYEAYTTRQKRTEYKLLIENPEIGKLYFEYDPRHAWAFVFEVVGGLNYPEGYFCDRLKEDGTETLKYYTSPVEEGILFLKNTGDNILVMSVTFAADVKYNDKKVWKGLTIVFDNGATISLPNEKITASVGETGDAILRANIILKKAEDLALMKEHEMKMMKFETEEKSIQNGRLLNEYYKCALKK